MAESASDRRVQARRDDTLSDAAPRSFAVDSLGNATSLSTEERVTLMGVSPSASAAYDLLTDDGVPAEQAAKLTLAAQKSGRDPEAFARHFLKLRRGLRASEGATP